MLLANLQFIFLSSIQTNSQQEDSDCDSSYPDACISSPPPNLNCKIYQTRILKFYLLTLMDLTVMKMVLVVNHKQNFEKDVSTKMCLILNPTLIFHIL